MSNVIKYAQRVQNTLSFKLHTDDANNNLYVGLGRSTSWSSEPTPDALIDDYNSETDFWTNLIGVSLVSSSETAIVFPRKDWATGTFSTYTDQNIINLGDVYAGTIGIANPIYTFNSTNGNVYECVVAGTSTIIPTGTGANIDMGDGVIRWNYLFNITNADMLAFADNSWLPIPSTEYSLTNYSVLHTLGANYFEISNIVADFATTGIPNVQYRQVAIILNPMQGDNLAVLGTANAVPGAAATDVSTNYTKGSIFQLENRQVISRQVAQSEKIVTIIQF